jgi:hypothetical protein
MILFLLSGCVLSALGPHGSGCGPAREVLVLLRGLDSDQSPRPAEPEVAEIEFTITNIASGMSVSATLALTEDADGQLRGAGCREFPTTSLCDLPAPDQDCERSSDFAVLMEFGGVVPDIELILEDDTTDMVCPWEGTCLDVGIYVPL